MRKQTLPSNDPATILTLTLHTDGSATLLAQRGEIAVLHAFTYRAMEDIVGALQQGATRLIDLGNLPPPTEFTPAESAIPIAEEDPPSPPSTSDTEDATPQDIADAEENTESAVPADQDQLTLF